MSSPDYPKANQYARDIQREFPHLSRQQAYAMAAIAERPDRNDGARFIGFDADRRPVHECEEYGGLRRYAHTRTANAAEVKYPVTRAVLPERRPTSAHR